MRTELSDGTITIRAYEFAIVRPNSQKFLGRVGLDRIRNQQTANVGYWVRTSETGVGIATAAGPTEHGMLENQSYCYALTSGCAGHRRVTKRR